MIYLDANATSRLRPEARAVFGAFASGGFELGNPSSIHALGRRARAVLTEARDQMLEFLGCAGAERDCASLFFTSGGTEACSAMIYGLLGDLPRLAAPPGRIVTTAIEHAAVEEPIRLLEQAGWQVLRVRPENDGIVSVEKFLDEAAVESNPQTALVCLMGANNETGAIQPVEKIAAALRAGKRSSAGAEGRVYSGPIVCDMTQALGKALLDLPALFRSGISAVALSGHKVGAPGGVGAVAIAKAGHAVCYPFHPLLRGGPQEERLRAGTENLPAIMAFGAVAEALTKNGDEEIFRISALRDQLWRELSANIPGIQRLTPPTADYESVDSFSYQRSLSNTLSVRIPGCRGDDLVVGLDMAGLAASTGSACASGKQSVSPVLLASGLPAAEAKQVIRLSLDWDCNASLISAAASIIAATARQMIESGSIEANA